MDLDPESWIRYTILMTVNVAEEERLRAENAALRVTVAERDEAIAARDAALAELAHKLRLTADERDYLLRRLRGRSSEKLPAGATLFDGLEDAPAAPADAAPDDEGSTLSEREKKEAKKRPTGRKPLPENLPRVRIEHPLDEADKSCSACGRERVRIGEETGEIVHFVPAHYEVHVHVRGKYACRCGEGGVVTPPAPPRPIPGSYAGPSLAARVLVAKYADHVPLHRQAGIFRREGFDIARSTLCDWVGGVMPLLAPVAAEVLRSVLTASYLQADETPVQVLAGPAGRPKEAYLWAYRNPATGEVAFDFRMGRGRAGPNEVLRDFRGTLQTDAYVGYDEVVRTNSLVSAGCLAHCRRKYVEALESSPKEAALVLVVIRRLYMIEERAKGMSPEERLRLRAAESKPRLAELKDLITTLAKDATPSSRLGKACFYALEQWEHLSVFAEDGRVEIDNNGIDAARGINSVMPRPGLCVEAPKNLPRFGGANAQGAHVGRGVGERVPGRPVRDRPGGIRWRQHGRGSRDRSRRGLVSARDAAGGRV